MNNLTEHWNKIYSKTDDNKLGWFESDFTQTIKFMNLIPDWNKSTIFVAGAGTSDLIDILLESNADIILNDLSTEVIEKLKKKYKKYKHRIKWNCQDLSKSLPANISEIDIWIDRAVLHFITNDEQVSQYFRNVNAVVKSGGYALFAEFSKSGAKKCAGLDVRRYDLPDFEENLPSFHLISSEEYTYINPNGDPRPYIYVLIQKNNA
jgi:ubiquinone/menaquinone biosynthesis C-methylase UbiE